MLTRKIKKCGLALLLLKVIKKILTVQHVYCVKLGEGSGLDRHQNGKSTGSTSTAMLVLPLLVLLPQKSKREN
jgi:hypothetical protein